MTKDKPGPYSRGKQILRILAEHGPLTTRGLLHIVRPQISERRLREVLLRLKDSGYITVNADPIFQGSARYYRLTRNLKLLKELSNGTLSMDMLEQSGPRERERLHSETCAIWTEVLRRMYPDAEVLREDSFRFHPLVSQVLLNDGRDSETRPDAILILQRRVFIAIEIERNQKSSKRLIRKLYRYAAQTRFDGVLYLCSSDDLATTLKTVYTSKVRQRALRIGPYGDNFLVFSDLGIPASATYLELRNSACETILCSDWLRILASNSPTARRDSQFKHPAAAGC